MKHNKTFTTVREDSPRLTALKARQHTSENHHNRTTEIKTFTFLVNRGAVSLPALKRYFKYANTGKILYISTGLPFLPPK